MRFPWMPREPEFFDMFDETAEMTFQAAELLVDLAEHMDCPGRRAGDMTELKRRCDCSIANILESLGRTFLPPLEREDIQALAQSLDEVLDKIDEAAFRLTAFDFAQTPAQAVKMALLIRRLCSHLQQAVHLCRANLGSAHLADELREVSRLNDEAIEVYRQAEVALFAAPAEVALFLKQHELYCGLRSAADACGNAANVVQDIAFKGS
jgi:uncharacterized protein